jgi:acetyl esterase/lipase
MVRLLSALIAFAATLCFVASGYGSTGKASTSKDSSAQLPAIADVSYGPAVEEELTVYPAAAGAGSASVLLVHGGGWRTQESETELAFVGEQLQGAGFAVFDADYPQDTKAQGAFPLEPDAILRAAEWVRANASAYGGSTSNIVFVGGSAGGQLVEMTANRFPVRGVVSLSGPTNLVALTEMARERELKDGLGGDVLIAARCESRSGCPESFQREWSPLYNIPAKCPPYLLFSSQNDEVPLSQQTEFDAGLASAGCSVGMEVFAGNQHSFEYWPKVRATVDAFIAAH